jgi:RTX calcium-binding nonapeptide repeat (4 copies)
MLRTLALCLGAVLALAPAALAATVSGALEYCTGGSHCRYVTYPHLSLTFEAAPGEVNELRVLFLGSALTNPPGWVRFVDARANLAPGDHCSSVNEHEAHCAPPPEQPASGPRVAVNTGDEADVVTSEIGEVMLGPGDDAGRGVGDIHGGPGDDEIRFEAPTTPGFYFYVVSFRGGPGQDVLVGGRQTNQLDGGGGPDDLVGGFGPDVLRGGGGDDEITGGRSGDGIHGDRGNDVIFAGGEDDRIAINDGQRDLARCGPGQDRVRVDPLDVVRGCERVILDPPR